MKKLTYAILCLLLNCSLATATNKRDFESLENKQEDSKREKKIQKIQQINEKIKIKNIQQFFEQLKTMSLNLKKTLFIFDLDGVLTNQSNPHNTRSRNKKIVKARGSIIDLIKVLKESGVHIIVSSAWKNFDETLQRVIELNLSEILNLNQTCIISDPLLGTKCYQNGNLISVRYISNPNQEFFPQKALSGHYAYPDLTFDDIVFIDDTKSNIDIFSEDIQEMSYAQNACIHLLNLSKINGGKKEKDIISPEDLESFKESCTSKNDSTSSTNEDQENEQININFPKESIDIPASNA